MEKKKFGIKEVENKKKMFMERFKIFFEAGEKNFLVGFSGGGGKTQVFGNFLGKREKKKPYRGTPSGFPPPKKKRQECFLCLVS